jgi:3-oxoacyl-[acyl-carrier protein] reductase
LARIVEPKRTPEQRVVATAVSPLVAMTGVSMVVTGGSTGIGAGIVALARELGARVGVIDLSPPSAADAHVQADVSRAAEARNAVDRLAQELSGVDVLVNNAGVATPGAFADLSEAGWRRTMEINVDGLFHCTQAALPHLRQAEGSAAIVNMGSIAGRSYSRTASVAYAASKGAVIAFTRQLAHELAGDGVRVNCVCPGLVDTRIMSENADEDRLAQLISQIPLGRLGSPREIAASVCFLASQASSYLTGTVLDATGGLV